MHEDLVAQYPDLEETHFWWRIRRGWVREVLRSYPGERLLDVGCGSGVTLMELAPLFHTAVGVEPNEFIVPVERVAEGSVRVGFLEDQCFPGGHFDAVLVMDVIEHLEDPTALLNEIRRVLAPNGVVLVTVPAFAWLWTNHDDINGHYRRYTRTGLDAELAVCGLRLVDARYLFVGLMVPKLLSRLWQRSRSPVEIGDLRLPRIVNEAAFHYFRIETRLGLALRRGWPVGTSLVAVATPVQ